MLKKLMNYVVYFMLTYITIIYSLWTYKNNLKSVKKKQIQHKSSFEKRKICQINNGGVLIY